MIKVFVNWCVGVYDWFDDMSVSTSHGHTQPEQELNGAPTPSESSSTGYEDCSAKVGNEGNIHEMLENGTPDQRISASLDVLDDRKS